MTVTYPDDEELPFELPFDPEGPADHIVVPPEQTVEAVRWIFGQQAQ